MRSNMARTCPACSFPACLPSDVEGAPRGAPARWRAGMGRLLAQREEIDDRCELLRWQVLERGHRRRRVHEGASDPLPPESPILWHARQPDCATTFLPASYSASVLPPACFTAAGVVVSIAVGEPALAPS